MDRIKLVGKSADGRRLIFARKGEAAARFELPITAELRSTLADAADEPDPPDHLDGHVRLFQAPPTRGPIRVRGRPRGLPPGALERATGLPEGVGPAGVRALVGEGGTALAPVSPPPVEIPAPQPLEGEDGVVHAIRSRLSAGEIQIRLRAGRTVAEVARDSGAPEDWVGRLDESVQRERLAAVGQMLRERMEHPDHGHSLVPLGDALVQSLQRRGLARRAAETGWSAARPRRGAWRVRFTFTEAGRDRWAEWRYDPRAREVTPADRLAAELGWDETPTPSPEPKGRA